MTEASDRSSVSNAVVLADSIADRFLRLTVASLNVRVLLTHSFLAYVPVSLAINRGFDWDTILIGGLISISYISLIGITNCSVNDFFDRTEDLWYKANPFNDDTKMGLAFILSLVVLSLLFATAAGSTYDSKIIVFSVLGTAISWWYSDNTYVKRVLGFRLKKHYILEMSAMVVGYLLFFASSLGINQVLISEATPLLVLVGLEFVHRTIKKDLWDVEKDNRAGNNTIPVMWGVKKATILMDLTAIASVSIMVYFSIRGLLPLLCIVAATWTPIDMVLRRRRMIYYRMRYIEDINPPFLLLSLGLAVT